ncbi:hypothetical protein F4553_006904 [Allocatelliglobosispora scoriae]|uniref:Uncharacterized protein n=1 Tax=Allocatelliglobosispora scoriae TaxID=643052 RepID=A0A841C3E1_9ACTN|nr:hypothetical protein [Allocatelliglobosispora scoriae]MBB5873470.1 hypothetical protein [Allocatelliglobosispora scoriae]
MTKNQAIVALAGLAIGLLASVSTATTTQILADSPWDSAKTTTHQSVGHDAARPGRGSL